jgi:membrane protein involved in colicin uptake
MTIKDILAKLQKGDSISDAEKEFLKTYDPDKDKNDAAAAARRKAEEERDTAKAEAEKLRKDADDAKKAAEDASRQQMTDAQKREADFKVLQVEVAKLTKERDDSAAKATAATRSQAIRDAAKAAGIALAPKTVSETLFFRMLEETLSAVDVADAAALTAALDKFKSDNPGVIAAPGAGSGVVTGAPAFGNQSRNPWLKDSFNLTEQVNLYEKEPDKARTLAAEAGVKLT